jgi:hypothetical protein
MAMMGCVLWGSQLKNMLADVSRVHFVTLDTSAATCLGLVYTQPQTRTHAHTHTRTQGYVHDAAVFDKYCTRRHLRYASSRGIKPDSRDSLDDAADSPVLHMC